MGSECRVEDMIIGSEKLVCYIHHSVTEGSHKVKDSEPEAMALMNIGVQWGGLRALVLRARTKTRKETCRGEKFKEALTFRFIQVQGQRWRMSAALNFVPSSLSPLSSVPR